MATTASTAGQWIKRRRKELDLTQEELAERAGCSWETVRKIEGGTLRPSRQLAELLAEALEIPASERSSFVQSLRGGPGGEIRPARVAQLAAVTQPAPSAGNPAAATAPAQPHNPYKGLRSFTAADNADFFGREALTARLVERLGQPVELARFLAVAGPSGSGKSSVVRAGLVPALKAGALPGSVDWSVLEVVPGAHPLEELEAVLLRIAVNPPASLLPQFMEDERGLLRAVKRVLADESKVALLVIDQFEEVFTLLEDEGTRSRFLNSLYAAVSDARSPLRVVITLRADFYDRPLLYPQFGALLRERTELVLPLAPDELTRAIARPAERVGVSLEGNLLALIVAEVGEQPGALPLLQYALTELFERREGQVMSLAAYRAIGGVAGALGRRAEEIYARLDAVEQEAARQMFLRLVTLGEGPEETRRRALRAELAGAAPDEEALERVLDLFGSYRFLTFDRDPVTRGPTVEIAHEALLGTWGRLREWLDTSRENLRVQRRLLAAASEWAYTGQDASFLAAGTRLAQFEALAASSDIALNGDERAYIAASVAARERQLAAEREQQQRELELARQAASSQRRAANRLRYLVVALGVFLLAAAGLAAFALAQRAQAEENFTRSEALRLAAGAGAVQQSGYRPELAALLAVRSMRTQYTPDGDAALGLAVGLQFPRRVFAGFPFSMLAGTFTPDSSGVVLGLGGRARRAVLLDRASGEQLREFKWDESADNGRLRNVALSPDGRMVLAATSSQRIHIWDLKSGQELRVLGGDDEKFRVAVFSPDSRLLLAGMEDGTACLLDAASGAEKLRFVGHGGGVSAVAFSPDGSLALTGSDDRTARVWNVQSGKELARMIGHSGPVGAVAFSPDGKVAITGGGAEYDLNAQIATSDNTARLWEVASGRPLLMLTGNQFGVRDVAYAPDGKTVLTAGDDGTARLWNVDFDVLTLDNGRPSAPDAVLPPNIGQEIYRFRALQTGVGVPAARFSPDGRWLLVTSLFGGAAVWDSRPRTELPVLSGHNAAVAGVAYSPDGKLVATSGGDGTTRIWDVASGTTRSILPGHMSDVEYQPAFSGDGKWLITGAGPDNTARIWDVATGQMLHSLKGHTDTVSRAIFSPDGRYALTGSYDRTARLWDAASGQQLREFGGHDDVIETLSFSADGAILLTSDRTGKVRLWDTASGTLKRELKGAQICGGPILSPDAKWLLTPGCGNTVQLLDAQTGQEIRRFVHGDFAQAVAFSPDGKMILTGVEDSTARLWDVETGKELRRFAGHTAAVLAVAFSPDGKTVLTGSADTTARIWHIDYRATVGYLCSRLGRDFTDDERAEFHIADSAPTCPSSGEAGNP